VASGPEMKTKVEGMFSRKIYTFLKQA
jgi:hypothetical protein